jgi:histidyl-tRNA synthetase
MKIQSAKGTRDFYPPQMAVRNFITDGWKAASVRNGFEEYDGPIFEFLKMYQIKSGEEIAEQLFSFDDRGGRAMAIRPEITPTLARMVNQQINSLGRPIKWFSMPRLCRAERPQKGRLREFFQWNVDIIGADDILADAEVIFTTLDYLRSVGLTPQDIKARISSRRLLAEFLKAVGIEADRLDWLYPILDKKPKVPAEAFDEMLQKEVSDTAKAQLIKRFMSLDDPEKVYSLLDNQPANRDQLLAAIAELKELFDCLARMSVGDYCIFDPAIVRGLAYYTGVVFEVHDAVGELRAVCGGGRYDNLLRDFGGPAVTATGMGMGDAVLEILLRDKGLLKDDMLRTRSVEYFVAIAGDQYKDRAVELAAKLRLKGIATEFSYKSSGLKKQLKQAESANAKTVVILGSELDESNELVVKDMTTGQQNLIDAAQFLKIFD